MKKLFLLGVMVYVFSMMTSCTISKQTVSPIKYLSTVDTVNASIESLGFSLSGTSSDQKNEVYVSDVSYSTQTGYGSAMNNRYYWYDTYRFTDSANNTVGYQVKYKYDRDDRGQYYISNVSVVGCDCSNPNYYKRICGDFGVTKQLNHIEKDQTSTFDDDAATLICIGFIILAGGGPLFLFLL